MKRMGSDALGKYRVRVNKRKLKILKKPVVVKAKTKVKAKKKVLPKLDLKTKDLKAQKLHK